MRFTRVLTMVVMAGALAACGGDEDGPTGGHGTPVNAAIYLDGVLLEEPIELAAGETMRLEVRFLDDDGVEIHDLLPSHTSELTFAPAAIATATADFDDAFFFDVAVASGVGGEGTVTVGYGHGDEIEQSFGPFDVVVVN